MPWKYFISERIINKLRRAREKLLITRPDASRGERHFDAHHQARIIGQPLRILVLRLDHVGDFVVSVSAFEFLRDAFPDASLEVLVGPWNAALAEATGLFDAVHIMDYFGRFNAGPSGQLCDEQKLRTALNNLALGHFDIVVDFRYFSDTRWVALAIEASFRAGFPSPDAETLDLILPDFDTLSIGPRIHMASRMMALAVILTETFGCWPLSRRHRETLRSLVANRQSHQIEPYFVINPFSGAKIKDWPIERYLGLCRELFQRYGVPIHVIGTGEGDNLAVRKSFVDDAPVIDIGRTVPIIQLINELGHAKLYLGNDSGTSHLAAALDVPVVALMSGVADPNVWRPLGPHVTVLRAPVPCSPCFLKDITSCQNNHTCIQTLMPSTVMMAVEEILNGDPQSSFWSSGAM